MDKSVKKIINAVVMLLATDLWGIHAKLIYALNPDKVGDVVTKFSYVAFNENTITAMLFALVFAFVPVLVLITINPKLEHYWLFVMIFAFFDGGAWFIYYSEAALIKFGGSIGAFYYGFFILFIVVSVGFIRNRLDDIEKEEKDEKTAKNAQIRINNPMPEYNNPPNPPKKEVMEERLKRPEQEAKVEKLTPTGPGEAKNDEQLLVSLLNQGFKNKQIAEQLGVAPSTITRRIQKMKLNGEV